jgi:hypothetical protein
VAGRWGEVEEEEREEEKEERRVRRPYECGAEEDRKRGEKTDGCDWSRMGDGTFAIWYILEEIGEINLRLLQMLVFLLVEDAARVVSQHIMSIFNSRPLGSCEKCYLERVSFCPLLEHRTLKNSIVRALFSSLDHRRSMHSMRIPHHVHEAMRSRVEHVSAAWPSREVRRRGNAAFEMQSEERWQMPMWDKKGFLEVETAERRGYWVRKLETPGGD